MLMTLPLLCGSLLSGFGANLAFPWTIAAASMPAMAAVTEHMHRHKGNEEQYPNPVL
jgi:hypothetical protein